MSKSHAVKLSTKVVLLLCALFTAYGAADYIVQRQVILPSFEALEADLARTDMERATRAIDSELTQLQTFGADWGNWLETYDFMAGFSSLAFFSDAPFSAGGFATIGFTTFASIASNLVCNWAGFFVDRASEKRSGTMR